MSDSRLIEPGRQPTRRGFLIGAAGAGLVAATGGLLIAGQRAALALTLQPNWGWCSLCYQSYFGGSPFQGRGICPKQPGDGHATPGWNYSMVYNQGTTSGLPGTPGYQAGWRWCQYCYSPYWPPTNSNGNCPSAEGEHSPGASFNYAMPVGLSGGYQGGWSPCLACSVLYHSNSGSGTDAGFCWVNYNRFGGKNTHSHNGNWPYTLVVNSELSRIPVALRAAPRKY